MKPSKRAEDIIKVFGMSNQLIIESLSDIEKQHSIELGHKQSTKSQDSYYAQFEQAVRAEASEMGKYYEIFYCLEKSIRKLVSENMEDAYTDKWWDTGKIPPETTKEVEKRIKKEIDSGVTKRSDDKLDYTTFGELGQIITSNWDVFGSIFESQRAVERVLANLNTLRGPIAHCSKLAEDEVLRLRLSVRDWFRIIA